MPSSFWEIAALLAALCGIVLLNGLQRVLPGGTKPLKQTPPPDPGEPDDCPGIPQEVDSEIMTEVERLLSRDQHMVLENGLWQYRRLGGNENIRGITGNANPDNPIGIIKCPYCNRKVQKDLDSCPGCGAPY